MPDKMILMLLLLFLFFAVLSPVNAMLFSAREYQPETPPGTTVGGSSGGSGGGGGGGSLGIRRSINASGERTAPKPESTPAKQADEPSCEAQWACDDWDFCTDNKQSRTCIDATCGQQDRTEYRSCEQPSNQITGNVILDPSLKGNIIIGSFIFLAAGIVIVLYYVKRKKEFG